MTPREINKLRLMAKLGSEIKFCELEKYFCMNCATRHTRKCTGVLDKKNFIEFKDARIFTCFERRK